MSTFDEILAQAPLVAILRGLHEDAIPVVEALYAAGVRVAEVPLNSPDPFTTLAALVRHFDGRMQIGAGTVLEVEEVERLAALGCAFCVSPNTDVAVIRATVAHGMVPMPGFSTPSEAFAAIAAGARHLKAFPAHGAAPRLSALSAVLPKGVQLVAVGGVAADDLEGLRAAGVTAVGVGSDLYKPGRTAEDVGARARTWLQVLRERPARAERVCNPQALVGESPRMLGDEVIWLDPTAPALLRWNGETCTRTPLSEPVWSLSPHAGRLVGNGETHLLSMTEEGRITPGPELDVGAGCRLNDMTVDARGGLWAGSMHRGLLAGKGALFYTPDPAQPARRVAEGLGVANGMVFSADGRTLFVVDTLARTLLAYPADIAAGTLGEPRVVTDFLGVPGKPDGLAMSRQGRLWVAMWGGQAVVELAENGAVLRSIAIPAPHVGALCFGPAGRLYVTTARARLAPEALAAFPGSGGLFVVTP
ncbi:2-dehydro-3-deoxy-6-phosphogalactonate aldolase [Stenotrophomonas sp. HITSZ_GD]|uniref:2-dehydro-3-deoxy-6-phosphogalactonate aldolase n=1 Tax=Stenotrophomonas sp. HITSZ_GD TaxID=3037248 RepID=UPI00240E451B|nr:2-dehydro-3-deoxy-6-phosphogalactonate aldolase [Stenotrophomonas sp. HITSZ_GD]MDG2523847.1 2-dehydro-3-deoxy-6-phosphogalactonate aldolase [Stenotrophomonas sp. HITSZ_GD]